jgi:glycosyltransferase involved in cell wall biosynthesis
VGVRILFSYSAVGRGGDAVQVLALAEALEEQGHQVRLAGDSPVVPYTFDTPGARMRGLVRRLPWWWRDALEVGLSCLASWRAWSSARRHPTDLLIHWAAPYDFAMAPVLRRLRVPLVLCLDAHVAHERGFRERPYWMRLHRRSMEALGREAAVIVTPSRAVADYYTELGLPASKIVVRPYTVRGRHLRVGLEAATTHPPLEDPARCTLGYVGSLARWHRVDLLLQAVRRLTEEVPAPDRSLRPPVPAFRVIIVGRGEDYEGLQAKARALGIARIVEWRGALPHDEAVHTMREFDIAVLPDTLPTGAPMKLMEYAAMARPIVAPDRPNIREMFRAGQDAALFPPGDVRGLAMTIRRLVSDPPGTRRMGLAAQARVRDLHDARAVWKDVIEAHLARAR